MSTNHNLVPDPTPQDPGELPAPAADVDQPSWLRRNMVNISLTTFVGGTAVSLATNPLGKLEHEVLSHAPWAIGAIAASETMWVGGAAMMAAAAGKKIGNPLTLKSRFNEVSSDIVGSKTFQAGLAINTVGAFGTAGTVATAAVTTLPAEAWPGAIGLAAADMAGTVALRSGVYVGAKEARAQEKASTPKVGVRLATPDDIDRLADIDLLLFDKAYGTAKPEKQEIVDMLHQRLANNPGWMYVAELDGEVEGFFTAFRTNKPLEDFESWEESTADGTLEGKVDPNGEYVYVANMTIKHEAVVAGAEEMLMANIFANGIRDGVKYGYFVSRMPHFKRWMEGQGIEPTKQNATDMADKYLNLRREEDGKRHDPQLRMYEGFGFELKRMVADAFEDDASMDYGVVFKAPVPPSENLKKIKPVRMIMAAALRQIAKKPNLLKKVF